MIYDEQITEFLANVEDEGLGYALTQGYCDHEKFIDREFADKCKQASELLVEIETYLSNFEDEFEDDITTYWDER